MTVTGSSFKDRKIERTVHLCLRWEWGALVRRDRGKAGVKVAAQGHAAAAVHSERVLRQSLHERGQPRREQLTDPAVKRHLVLAPQILGPLPRANDLHGRLRHLRWMHAHS